MKGAHADIKLNSPAGNILTRVRARMQMLFFVFYADISVVKSASKHLFWLDLFNLGPLGYSQLEEAIHRWQGLCYKRTSLNYGPSEN